MQRRLLTASLGLALAALTACSTTGSTSGAPDTDPAAEPAAEPDPEIPRDPVTARVTVVGISDFHGWLLPLEPKGFKKYYGGIAHLAGMFEHAEKLDPKTSLIIDNGDMWTGPTESTLLRGEPVIKAYNELGVDAANIANHEFDYGLEILKARVGEAKFPFLAANITRSGTDEAPSFLKPWTIFERDGVKVGVVGLAFIGTPQSTLAVHVQGLEFKPYAETLERVVPEIKKAGAEVVLVAFHDRVSVIADLLEAHGNFGVHAIIAGQSHRKGKKTVKGVPIVNPGPFGRSYVRFEIAVDRQSRQIQSVDDAIVDVTGEVGAPTHPPSSALEAIAEGARQKAHALAGEVLGKLAKPLPVGTFANSPLGHLIVDAWLSAFPDVDFAVCNIGSLRQPLGAGPLTIGDLTSVMPFENNLYVVKLTGAQLKAQLVIDGPIVGGLTWKYRTKGGKRRVMSAFDRVGQPILDTKTYAVVVNDFMYFGGDGFRFKEVDATPEDTGLSWREPVIRTLRLAAQSGKGIAPPAGARAALKK